MEELCFYGIGNGKRDHEEWKGGFDGLRILQVWFNLLAARAIGGRHLSR